MINYWDPKATSMTPRKRGSSNKKLIAVIIILVVSISAMIAIVLQGNIIPGGSQNVRVAVVDSGVNSDLTLQGKIVAAKSFVTVENGYDTTDTSTGDASPDGVSHGTAVARAVVQNSANAVIVNAKVLGPDGTATAQGILAAIEWSVEVNCSVINLSLGSFPTVGDPLEDIIEWAFSRGVVVVAAAGNEGDSGIAGTSINAPSVFPHCVSVAGLTEDDSPAAFSSIGPTRYRTMKPDISAPGYVQILGNVYYGTSFASPRVAAGVADLIAFCIENNIAYSAGLIITALLKGADPLPYESYEVGAGKLDVTASIALISQTSDLGGLPAISFAQPGTLPADFERFFYGDTYRFTIQLYAPGMTVFNITVSGILSSILDIQDSVIINQTGAVDVGVDFPDSGAEVYSSTVTFESEEFGSTAVAFDFSVSNPIARIAFDVSHTTWSIDSYYGQFREFYKDLTTSQIAVNQIEIGDEITLSLLEQFDAVVMLDPCAWDINETNYRNPEWFSIPYTFSETLAYQQYFESGGGIFVVGLANESSDGVPLVDTTSLNSFLSWSGFSLGLNTYPSSGSVGVVDDLVVHPVTEGIAEFDYLGAEVIVPASGVELATLSGRTVLGALEGPGGGRMVVSGTNYFVDNWAYSGEYSTLFNDDLSSNIIFWIADLLS